MMNSKPWIRTMLLAAAMAFGVTTAPLAAVTVFTTFTASVNGGVKPIEPSGAVTVELSAFRGELADESARTENFESFEIGATRELTLFGSDSGISLTGRGEIKNNPFGEPPDENTPGEFFGRFNTTSGGSKWWETSSPFSISFKEAISAFGFYLTDFGDFDGALTLLLFIEPEDQAPTKTQAVLRAEGIGNGSLTFFSFVDPKQSYRRIDFQITQAECVPGSDCADDYLGFDDLIVGALRQDQPPPNGTPEPNALGLLALALLGLGWATRRRSPGRVTRRLIPLPATMPACSPASSPASAASSTRHRWAPSASTAAA